MTAFSATALLALLGASTAFASYAPAPSAPVYGGGADACSTKCVTEYRTCQGNTTNPRSFCASQISSCLGYLPYDTSGSFVTPTACATKAVSTSSASTSTSTSAAPTAPAPTGCAAACVAAYRTCQGTPGSNKSLCASNISQCLGYTPFDNGGSFVTPTACSTTVPATSAPYPSTSPCSTTAPAPAPTAPAPTGCAAACVAAYRTCQGTPGSNKSLCASNISQCLGYTPFDNGGSFVTPTACSTTVSATSAPASSSTPCPTSSTSAIPTAPAPTGCAAACVAAYRTCQGTPGSNKSLCASNISQCLGYTPFDNGGSFVTPTACSTTVPATSAPHPSTSPCSTTALAPAPTAPAPAPSGGCAADCVTAYRTCQSNRAIPKSQCASEISHCLGYSPFDNGGSFVTPTACSSTVAPTQSKTSPAAPAPPAPTATSPAAPAPPKPTATSPAAPAPPAPTGTAPAAPAPPAPAPTGSCATECIAAYRACQGAPDANQSLCASNISDCLGYFPFDNSGFVTPTACSGTPITTSVTTKVTTPTNASTTAPAQYTGAAAIMHAGAPLAAMAAGAAALLI